MDAVHKAAILQAGVLCLQSGTGVSLAVADLPVPATCLLRPPLTSTFSTTCLPKEHTLVETLMVILSAELYCELTP